MQKTNTITQYVIIVAGGSGQRMQSAIPKQFLELAGEPILLHTIRNFTSYNPDIQIIVVLPQQHIATWKNLIEKHSFSVKHTIINGGDVRFISVKNGLNAVADEGLVAIHDGVRPLVSHQTIRRCFDEAKIYGNAIPCIPVYETVRKVNDKNSTLEDRSALRLIQTPQVFKTSLIKKAYEQQYKPEFTDDASVLENMGEQIRLVEGNRENIKITDPTDLLIAEAFLKPAT
jgi:2-C-methyl-D-erythritol 4-phosphate cytidylyltransferase